MLPQNASPEASAVEDPSLNLAQAVRITRVCQQAGRLGFDGGSELLPDEQAQQLTLASGTALALLDGPLPHSLVMCPEALRHRRANPPSGRQLTCHFRILQDFQFHHAAPN